MDTQVELIQLLREEQQRVHEEQQTMHEKRCVIHEQRESRQYISRMLETIRDMAFIVVKLEKRLTEGETTVVVSKLKPIVVLPPPPPMIPTSHIPHVLVVLQVVGQYVMPPPRMLMFSLMQGGAMSDQAMTTRPR